MNATSFDFDATIGLGSNMGDKAANIDRAIALLTADGKVRTCLFSVVEHDLRARLRNGAGDEELREWLQGVVWQKEDRHHIGEPEFVPPERSMSCIGG